MFNLVKYRYAFIALSLLVIVPGLISLIFFGLNLGTEAEKLTLFYLKSVNPNIKPVTFLTGCAKS